MCISYKSRILTFNVIIITFIYLLFSLGQWPTAGQRPPPCLPFHYYNIITLNDRKHLRNIVAKCHLTCCFSRLIIGLKYSSFITGKAKKGKEKDGSDYEPEDEVSDEDFKPTKISPKPSTSRKIDRRVISSEDKTPKDKTDVWCEVFVEELEQWIAVDVVRGKVHCTNEIYVSLLFNFTYT